MKFEEVNMQKFQLDFVWGAENPTDARDAESHFNPAIRPTGPGGGNPGIPLGKFVVVYGDQKWGSDGGSGNPCYTGVYGHDSFLGIRLNADHLVRTDMGRD